jgi:hypothetical protein
MNSTDKVGILPAEVNARYYITITPDPEFPVFFPDNREFGAKITKRRGTPQTPKSRANWDFAEAHQTDLA